MPEISLSRERWSAETPGREARRAFPHRTDRIDCVAAGEQFDGFSRARLALGRLGHRQQHVDALLLRERLADDVQAVRDQRVFELEHRVAEFGDRRRRARSPCGVRLGQIELGGLRLDRSRRAPRARARRPARSCAPAFQRGLEVEEPAIQPRVGDRRRQVADQSRGGAALGDRALGRIVRRVEIEVRQIADQPVRPARLGQTGLLSWHEFQRAMRAKMQHRVGARSPPSPTGRRPKMRASARSLSRTRDASDRPRSRRRAGCRQKRCRTVRRARESTRRRTVACRAPDPIAARSGGANAPAADGRRSGFWRARWPARQSGRNCR